MQITLNGSPHELDDGSTVRQLVEQVSGTVLTADGRRADGQRLGIAVAVDQVVVARSRWDATPLAAGQAVDIVTAVQGG